MGGCSPSRSSATSESSPSPPPILRPPSDSRNVLEGSAVGSVPLRELFPEGSVLGGAADRGEHRFPVEADGAGKSGFGRPGEQRDGARGVSPLRAGLSQEMQSMVEVPALRIRGEDLPLEISNLLCPASVRARARRAGTIESFTGAFALRASTSGSTRDGSSTIRRSQLICHWVTKRFRVSGGSCPKRERAARWSPTRDFRMACC